MPPRAVLKLNHLKCYREDTSSLLRSSLIQKLKIRYILNLAKLQKALMGYDNKNFSLPNPKIIHSLFPQET